MCLVGPRSWMRIVPVFRLFCSQNSQLLTPWVSLTIFILDVFCKIPLPMGFQDGLQIVRRRINTSCWNYNHQLLLKQSNLENILNPMSVISRNFKFLVGLRKITCQCYCKRKYLLHKCLWLSTHIRDEAGSCLVRNAKNIAHYLWTCSQTLETE